MLESKRLPRAIETYPETKQDEQGGNRTLIVGLANHWGSWSGVYSYIRPQKVRVFLQTLPIEGQVHVWGEMKIIDKNGTSRIIKVLGGTEFTLELGRAPGPARKKV